MGRYNGGSSGVGAKTGDPTFAIPVLTSQSITFTRSGRARLVVVGAGGSGARAASNSPATGGNSAPWGVKEFNVAAGDTLVLNMGARAAGAAVIGANGNAGGTTTVVLNGTTIMTVTGGEGGLITGTPAPVVSTVTGADYWVAGQMAGSASGSNNLSGGAAVDAVGMGVGRSPNSSTGTSPGGVVGINSSLESPLPFNFSMFGLASNVFNGTSSNFQTSAISGAATVGAGSGAVGNGSSYSGAGGQAYAYLTFTAS